MPYIDLDEDRLYFAVHRGADDGTPLILVHGAAGSHLIWPAELRRLPGRTVYALDLPGHGRSSPRGRQKVSEYADVVLAFIAASELRNVVIVGHSMGGAIALEIGLRRPESVSGLILIGTGARLRVSPAILGEILVDFEEAISVVSRYSWASGAPEELVSAGKEQMLQVEPEVAHGDFSACDQFDLMGRLGEINLPTLVVGSSEDLLTPPKYSEYLAASIPGAQLVLLDGAGHMMALERPDQLVKAISRFLSQLTAR